MPYDFYSIAAHFIVALTMLLLPLQKLLSSVFAVIMAKLEEYCYLIYFFRKSVMPESTIAMQHIQQHLLLLYVEQLLYVLIESTNYNSCLSSSTACKL
jgi:hypothetical protein